MSLVNRLRALATHAVSAIWPGPYSPPRVAAGRRVLARIQANDPDASLMEAIDLLREHGDDEDLAVAAYVAAGPTRREQLW